MDNAPVVLAAFGADKGTEDMFDLSGTDFTTMFGDPSYKKYGQGSIQIRKLVDAGARVVGKRVVADDAALANAYVVATVYKKSIQRQNEEGLPLYVTPTGEITTTSDGNTPLIDNTAKVKYLIKSASAAKSIDAVLESATTALDDTGTPDGSSNTVFSYPLFAITDNGRGVSNKRFSITPLNSLSKNLNFMYYRLSIIEDNAVTDKVDFSIIPDKIANNQCIDLTSTANNYLTLAKAKMIEEGINKFVARLSDCSDVDEEDLWGNDILFGTNRKGISYETIDINTTEGINLSTTVGVALSGGSNGSFKDYPITEATTAFNAKLLSFYDGSDTDEIWNLDTHQIDLCFDSNLPLEVKNAIVKLANYRKDFMFFRDLGTEVYSLSDVVSLNSKQAKSTFVTTFCQSYETIDEYAHKQVPVTMIYGIAPLIMAHIRTERHQPFAGKRFDAIIPDVIKGTLRYAPKVTPVINEKTELEELRVNFASYYVDELTVESLYTSQEDYTQLSFSNNVMALQQVIKTLRVRFPAIRYQFITTAEDMKAYESEINSVISQYSGNFASLQFAYTGDNTYISNKIYKAALYFQFNDFVQAEIIDAYCLPTA